jgi:parallel beta-helix repeat protein
MCKSKKKYECCGQTFNTKKNITKKGVANSLTKRTSNHFYLFFTVILTLFLSLPCIALANSYTDITVSEAKTMIESNPSLVILDVRNQSEYNSGHIRNAKLIPVYELESRLDELNINDEILVYCKVGGRSSVASEILASNGFSYVYNMLGGITAWINEGYSVYVKYSSIQEAINYAAEGDVILFGSGTYHQSFVVNKTVNLVGEDAETTLICGNRTQPILKIANQNVNVTSFTIQNGTEGIYLMQYADSCTIKDCKIVNNSIGIFVKSDDNLLIGNIIGNNSESGIKIYAPCSCSPVEGNNVIETSLLDNSYGVQLINSDRSSVYHNNFINNTHQATCSFGVNMWDSGYPSGGNYWSGYNGTDLYSGFGQNETGRDGIGDAPHNIYFGVVEDVYPLMASISVFDAYTENEALYSVNIISNSTVSAFYFNPDDGAFLRFNMTGKDGTTGFCRVTIPKDLLWVENSWTVIVSGEQAEYKTIPDENYTYLFFTYQHSRKTIEIQGTHVIPEFPSLFILPLFMLTTLLAAIVYERKHPM